MSRSRTTKKFATAEALRMLFKALITAPITMYNIASGRRQAAQQPVQRKTIEHYLGDRTPVPTGPHFDYEKDLRDNRTMGVA